MARVIVSPTKMSNDYRIISLKRMSGFIGCEISGVDLFDASVAAIAEIKRALSEHLVLVFRNQSNVSRDSHLRLAMNFGDILRLSHFPSTQEHPEIGLVHREANDKKGFFGEAFHCDSTFLKKPPTVIVMRGVELPPFGGDTAFSNLYVAYESLSERMRKLIDGLKVVHSDSRIRSDPEAYEAIGSDIGYREAIHPLAVRHPITGRKALFLNPKLSVRFDGMTEDESAPLLNFLLQHLQFLPFTTRVRWEPDTIVVWDNWTASHSAIGDYQGYRRTLERVTLYGPEPTG